MVGGMGRRKRVVTVFIDTHVVVWLYANIQGMLSAEALSLIDEADVLISPMTVLELEYLLEIGKIKTPSRRILDFLGGAIGLAIADDGFPAIVDRALRETWTRDPFDRIIVAHARLRKAPLVTRDSLILKHYAASLF